TRWAASRRKSISFWTSAGVNGDLRAMRGRARTEASSARSGSLVTSVKRRSCKRASVCAGKPCGFSCAETSTLVSMTARKALLAGLFTRRRDLRLDFLSVYLRRDAALYLLEKLLEAFLPRRVWFYLMPILKRHQCCH